LSCGITLQRGLAGVKPEPFAFWIFALLGVMPGDELIDLFPGSGAITAAFARYQSQLGFARYQSQLGMEHESPTQAVLL
jgi:predicted methyltransferase